MVLCGNSRILSDLLPVGAYCLRELWLAHFHFVADKFIRRFWRHLPRYGMCVLTTRRGEGLGHQGKVSLWLSSGQRHCRGDGFALAVSPCEKTRGLIHLNRFLICGDVFLFSSLELRNLNLLLQIGACCTEKVRCLGDNSVPRCIILVLQIMHRNRNRKSQEARPEWANLLWTLLGYRWTWSKVF